VSSWSDALLPAGLVVVGVLELALLRPEEWLVGAVIECAAAALLVPRKRHPLLFATLSALVLVTMPYVGPQLDEPAAPILFLAVSMYTLARWVPDLRGLLGMAAVLGLMFVDYAVADARDHDWSDVVFVLALLLPPYVLGRIARKLAEQSELLRRHQELVRRDAVRSERDRIARDLHDVIAHSISAMVVQTAAAQDLVGTDPDRAQSVLADVAATGRRALAETGQLLHVLRDEDDELGLGPAPGTAELPDLVEAFRASGLDVDYQADMPWQLPPALDLSVYRIVQEALTNALKHGSGRSAVLRLSSTESGLDIRATNPVGNGAGAVGGSGLGLLGIEERVSLLGGRLTHGRDQAQRFHLSVTLPVVGHP